MILLDTHAWIWWVADPERLPALARAAIDDALTAGDPVLVSAISVWEVAMLVDRGRLELTLDVADWVGRSEAAQEIRFVPLDPRIALASVTLEDFPNRDPADRMIVATARDAGAVLVTADARLQAYEGVSTLWD